MTEQSLRRSPRCSFQDISSRASAVSGEYPRTQEGRCRPSLHQRRAYRHIRASGARTHAANGRVDAEVSGDACRATGSTNQQHSHEGLRELPTLPLPAQTSHHGERRRDDPRGRLRTTSVTRPWRGSVAALISNESYGLGDAPGRNRRSGVADRHVRRDRFDIGRPRRAHHRNGDVPIVRDESPDLASGAVVGERPDRLCIGGRAFLHGSASAMLPATSASQTKRPDAAFTDGYSTGRTPASCRRHPPAAAQPRFWNRPGACVRSSRGGALGSTEIEIAKGSAAESPRA